MTEIQRASLIETVKKFFVRWKQSEDSTIKLETMKEAKPQRVINCINDKKEWRRARTE